MGTKNLLADLFKKDYDLIFSEKVLFDKENYTKLQNGIREVFLQLESSEKKSII